MSKLLKTTYFLSEVRMFNECSIALQTSIGKRDDFLKDNLASIGQIVSEKIDFVAPANNTVFCVITLSYFEKP